MNAIKYRVSLDMFDTLSQTTIKAKKLDSACQIHITLTENGKIYKIGKGCYATFNAKKSDGNFIYDNCTIENNTIVYDFGTSVDENGICQVSAYEGIVECEVTLYKANSEQLTSPRFTLFIDGTVYNGEEVISTSEANAFKELINGAEKKVAEAIEKAEATIEELNVVVETSKSDISEAVKVAEQEAIKNIGAMTEGEFNVTQNMGGSATLVMSQKAVTDCINERVNKANLNNTQLESGSLAYANGVAYADDKILRTNGYISVEGNTLYQIYSDRLNLNDVLYMFEYDENKTFIQYQYFNAAKFESGLTTHANTRFIRLRTQTNGTSGYELCPIDTRIMVEKGDTKTYNYDGIFIYGIPFPCEEETDIIDNLATELKDFTNAMASKEFDLGFLAITDSHSRQDDVFKIMSYFAKNHIGDFVVHMGDIAIDTVTKEEKASLHKQFFETARSGGGADVYLLRGNHDNNHISNINILNKDYHISDKDFYNQATRNANGVVKEYPYNYFYRDFEEYKIRVVFLDSGDIYKTDGEMNTSGLNVMYQQRQIDWFKNKALNFADKSNKREWSVLTISHSGIETAYMQNILNAFLNGTSYTGTANISYAEEPFDVDLSCDFTKQGAMEYIGHISGHLHADNIKSISGISPTRHAVEVKNATTPNVNIPNITMDDIAMDFIAINKTNRTISAYRFGVGADREIGY